MSSKILLVEDDPNLGEILSEYLTLKGFETLLARDGDEGERKFKAGQFDLCILDLMMPKKDGFTLAKDLRLINEKIPIIFLTAKSMKQDVIKGFTLGADDYVTKPFSMEELLMRIRAVLKRSHKSEEELLANPFKIGLFTYYHEDSRLVTPSKEIQLTTKENQLLKLFFQNIGKTLQRSIALKKIWKDDSYFNARSMDVYIAKLRKYLSEDPSLKILTIHGEGFKLIETK